MTQQEQQHRGLTGDTAYVPGPREGEHDDDVAVGTAAAPDRQEPEHGESAESYPAGTYASGSADTDTTDRDDVEVVDRDEAMAEETEAEQDDRQDQEEEAVAEAEQSEDERWEAQHAAETDETAHETGEAVAPEPAAAAAAAAGALWEDGAVEGLRERWRALQLRFIDEPREVAGEADELVAEAVASVTGALEAQRRELAAWQGETGDDTERLRTAVRSYRDFLDRLLGL